jgi:restriction endonuclease S subunit
MNSHSNVTANWPKVRLEALSTVISKGTTPTSLGYSYCVSGVPFVRAEDVNGGAVNSTKVSFHISEDVHATLSRSRLQPGDLLITIAGTLGRVGYIPDDSPSMNCNQAVAFARLKPELIDIQYAVLVCKIQSIFESLTRLSVGGAIPNLNLQNIRSIEIPLPPLSEQKRIVAILNNQMEAVENAREAARDQLSASKALPPAYLREAFESEEAREWPKRKLGNILTLRNDVIHPKNNPTGEAVFVGLEHVESLTGRRTGALVLRKELLTGRKPQFYRGDIVYGYLRPYLNKLWIAEFDGLCSVDQYVYSIHGSVADTEFVAWFMRSPLFLKRAPINTSPGQLPRIRTDEVANVEINLPDLEKQQSVARSIRDRISSSIEMISNTSARIESLNFLSAALLKHAFNGHI